MDYSASLQANFGVCTGEMTLRNGRFVVEKGLNSVRINDEALKCVGFIGEVTHTDADGNDSGELYATGFFVGVPVLSPELLNRFALYFVTAKHVAADLVSRKVYFAVNKVGGGTTYATSIGDKWWFHPTDTTADLAIIPVNHHRDMDIKAVPLKNIGTKGLLEGLSVGVGDEIYATGLFTPAAGGERHLPIVRHGNIAMMPDEQIQTELGYADVYLVEARSIGGLSGSPVFVRPTIALPISENRWGFTHTHGVGPGATLLGLMHGHWDIKESEMNKASFTHDRKYGVNYGVAIVVPAYKIVETLNRPELIEMRKQSEEIEVKRLIPGMD